MSNLLSSYSSRASLVEIGPEPQAKAEKLAVSLEGRESKLGIVETAPAFQQSCVGAVTITSPAPGLRTKEREEEDSERGHLLQRFAYPPGLDLKHPIMTSVVRSLLEILWAIVMSRALKARFPIVDAEVMIFRDPEEEKGKAVLHLFAKVNAGQAVAFWDSLEEDLQEWLHGLDEAKQIAFKKNITMRIHWQ